MNTIQSNSGISLRIEPKGPIYSNTSFKVSLSFLMTSYIEKANFSVYIVGIEEYGKDKVNRHKFFKQIIVEKCISILPNTSVNYNYPCAIDKQGLPSSFEYNNLKEKVKGSIYYEVRARIKTKDNKKLYKELVVLPYCSYSYYDIKKNFSKEFFNEKIKMNVELDKEIYRADEKIECKCKVTKQVWDMCTNLSKVRISCKFRQTLTIKESLFRFFSKSTEYIKDLLEIQYASKVRPDYADQNAIEFPICIDLKVTSLAVAIKGSTKGDHLENSYSLLFDLRLEDSAEHNEKVGFVIPLHITAA